MEYWVLVVSDMTADILSSSFLVDCVLFSDFDSAFCDSAQNFCVAILNANLYFGVDTISGQSGIICPEFSQK